MLRKAQAAMEFLMTYGWAILVVLAAIAALAYFGVLSPGNLLPQKCEFSSGTDCVETPSAVRTANTITVALVNSNGFDMLVGGSIGTAGDYTCNNAVTFADYDADGTWENGEAAVVTFSCTALPDAGERYRTDLSFNYSSSSSGMEHRATGTVAGKVA